MNDEKLVGALQVNGLVLEECLDTWKEATVLMAAIDAMSRDGVTAVVKIDGGRHGMMIYTVVVSGPRLGDLFFRKDGSDLLALLRDALDFYKTEILPK